MRKSPQNAPKLEDLLKKFLSRTTGRDEDSVAEAVVQFLKQWRKKGEKSFTKSEKAFAFFLRQLAWQEKTKRRKEQREEEKIARLAKEREHQDQEVPFSHPDDVPTPEDIMLASERQKEARDKLEKLIEDPTDLERLLEGEHTGKEIAQALGKTPEAFRVWRFRIRQNQKERLANEKAKKGG